MLFEMFTHFPASFQAKADKIANNLIMIIYIVSELTTFVNRFWMFANATYNFIPYGVTS